MKVQEKIAAKRCSEMVGRVYKVLVENEGNKENMLSARTSGNIIVEIQGDTSLIGSFVNVKITGAKNWVLSGEILE